MASPPATQRHTRLPVPHGLIACRAAGAAALIVILGIGGWLRFHRLAEQSYYFDESFCVLMSQYSVPEIVRRLGLDTRPPLYFLILKSWASVLGTSPLVYRGLSAVCGVLTIVGIWAFLREAESRPDSPPRERFCAGAALLGAALVAISPFQIEWSTQVNVYAFGAALTAFSSCFLLRALRTGRILPDWGLYTVTAAMLLYAHPYGIFTVAAQYVFALLYELWGTWTRRRPGPRWVPLGMSLLCVEFLWQFWLPSFLAQRARVTGDFWSGPLTWPAVLPSLLSLVDEQQISAAHPDAGFWVGQGLVIGLLVLLLGRRTADAYVVVAVALPLVAAIGYSFLVRNIITPRYFLFVQTLLLAAAALLIWRLPRWWLRTPVALLLLGALGTRTYQQYASREHCASVPGLVSVLEHFERSRGPDEPLVVCHPMLFTSVAAHSQVRGHVFVYGHAGHYPFFYGTAVLRDVDYCPKPEDLAANSRWLWTLNADQWGAHSWHVPAPTGYELVAAATVPEYYCQLQLLLYKRTQPSADARGLDIDAGTRRPLRAALATTMIVDSLYSRRAPGNESISQ